MMLPNSPHQALTPVYLPDAGRTALALGTTHAIHGVVTLLTNSKAFVFCFVPDQALPLLPPSSEDDDFQILIRSGGWIVSIDYSIIFED